MSPPWRGQITHRILYKPSKKGHNKKNRKSHKENSKKKKDSCTFTARYITLHRVVYFLINLLILYIVFCRHHLGSEEEKPIIIMDQDVGHLGKTHAMVIMSWANPKSPIDDVSTSW